MKTKQEIRKMLSKSRAVSRMRVNLFENQVTDREVGHSKGYEEALEWVLEDSQSSEQSRSSSRSLKE